MASTSTAPTSGSPGAEHAGLFVRKSSGLVREMGIRDTLSVAIGGINPALVVAVFFAVLSFASNASLTWPYIVAALIMIPLALTYAQLVASIPRTGGDYIWLSRVFSPVLGAAVGVGFLLFVLLLLGSNAVAVANYALPEFLRATGVAIHSHSLVTFSSSITTHLGVMITAGIVIASCCFVGLFGGHALGRAMWWCFVAALVGVVVMIVEALAHSGGSFQAAYDHANGAGAYQHVLIGAQHDKIATGSTFAGFQKLLPYAAIGFWGFTVANFPAGELKRPAKNYVRGTLVGLAIGALFLVTAWLAIEHLAGLRFLQSAAALATGDPTAFAQATHGGAPVVTQYYADLVSGDPVSKIVISFGFVLGSVICPLVWLLTGSRLMFALSFDRLLPTRLADVNERTHAPIKALLASFVGGLLFAYLTVYSTGFVHAARNQVLIFAFIFTLGSIAGVGLVMRRRALYDASPHVIGGRWFGQPPILFVAGVSAALQAVLLYEAATNTAISGGYDAGSIATLVICGASGLVVYAGARLFFRSRGMDLRYSMKELPPE